MKIDSEIVILDEKDQESFRIVEEHILKYGLKNLGINSPKIYRDHFKILQNRLISDQRVFSIYLSNLDNVYEFRTQFIDHMHNQNVIQVCRKDIHEKQIEIDRLKTLVDNVYN